ncbi:MAG: polyprenyl synthetase family protein [Pirellulales bacterium]
MPERLACPDTRQMRDRLRALAADAVASWRAEGLQTGVRTAAALRREAAVLVARAAAPADLVGWMMVALVSEQWRERLAGVASGKKLLLLPDCPRSAAGGEGMPGVCGPDCGIATIWAAARDQGWVVESTSRAVAAIGSLLTGQYDGVLGVARLRDLEKAFAMLPAFGFPIAAVPCEPVAVPTASCADALAKAAIDVDWVLGLLGVAGGAAAPVGDYLPLLREAAGMFTPAAIVSLSGRLGVEGLLEAGPIEAAMAPLDAPAIVSGDFLGRGGKFLRPFVTLAAFDAVEADLRDQPQPGPLGYAGDPAMIRESAKAAAVAIEIFHKASLVHDDIEDDDPVRYGRQTLHREVGVPSAINAGDYLLGAGYRIMAALPGLDAGTIRDCLSILADAHVRLARGQGAELWWRDAPAMGFPAGRPLSPGEALEIYGLKTSPAFEAAVALGIRLAGLSPGAACDVARYALHVGTGFQVLNDLKDWAGDVENDRRAASDLVGGRPTVMWALALAGLPAADATRLRGLASAARGGSADDAAIVAAVAEARHLYAKAGVVEQAAAIAAEQRRLAAAAIAGCRLRRLREVLEFLLDLAVPDGWAPGQ